MIMLTKNDIQQLVDEGYIWIKNTISKNDVQNVLHLKFPNANSKEKQSDKLDKILSPLRKKIQNNLSKHFNCKFLKAEIWDDVDAGSKKWHNDNHYKKSDANLTVLIYCDEIKDGNTIEIRGPISEIKITPDRYHMIMINQNKKFEHKASIRDLPRRVIGMQYFCEELKWI